MSAVQADDIFITNHHPYILTLVFSWFIKLGLHFGDICIGVAAYVILQMIALSLVFAGCLYYIRTCGVTTKRMIGALLILMFLLILPYVCHLYAKGYGLCHLLSDLYYDDALCGKDKGTGFPQGLV